MTPLQLILLGHKMRQMQTKRVTELRHKHAITAHYDELRDIEAAFDKAVLPYVDYAKAMEELPDGK